MIRFKKDTELELVTKTDNITDTKMEFFQKGDIADGEIIGRGHVFGDDSSDKEYFDLEFCDGSIAYSVERSCFEVLKFPLETERK